MSLKIQILADLHHEFVAQDSNGAAAWSKMKNTYADLTIVAGDLYTRGRSPELAAHMWPDRPVVLVAGNHEYYGTSWPAHIDTLRTAAAEHPNVHFLENDVVEIGGVVFLGCTLWTDCKLWEAGPYAGLYDYPETIRDVQDGMTDYGVIRFAGPGGRTRPLKPSDTIQAHLASVRWFRSQFEAHRGRKIVVVTHHAPSFRSVPETFSQDIISAAFASHLDELVESSGAAYWIHGHNHFSTDYMIGKTRVICNPRGYPNETATGFKPALVVKI